MFVNKEIYFASPKELNDPYYCQIDIDKSLNLAVEKAPTVIKPELEKYKQVNGLLQKIKDDAKSAGIFFLYQKSPQI